jgi:GcrA cell cycle regulator
MSMPKTERAEPVFPREEWPEPRIERLRALWAEGHATAEIGRRMGLSKSAVVGKAHRLDLPARSSPIRPRTGEPPPPPIPRVRGPTLTPLAALADPASPNPSPVRLVVEPPPPEKPTIPCCWPLGEPGTKGFGYCGVKSLAGKPYCFEHARLAYVRVRDRREDAA